MEVPPDVLQGLGKLEDALATLDGFLSPFVSATPRELETALTPLDRVRAHIALARAAALLAGARLRLRGEAITHDHALARERARLGRYAAKLERALMSDARAPGSDLNLAAAARMIAGAAGPALTREQRAAVRAAGEGAEARRAERRRGPQGQQRQGGEQDKGGSGSGGGQKKRAASSNEGANKKRGGNGEADDGGGGALDEILAVAAGGGET